MYPSLPRVADLMRLAPSPVSATTPASEVATYMHAERQRHVFVADDEGRLYGLVNRARLLRHLVARGLADDLTPDLPIGALVVHDLVTITSEATAADALRLMRQHHVGCLPVLDAEGHLIGLLSERMLLGCVEQIVTGG